MSWSQVCGFIATKRSTPPRRPRHPASFTRTSNHVGRPWMFDGKMLRGATGTPMRRIDLAKSRFADADPEPFTLANFTTKSLTRSMGVTVVLTDALPRIHRRGAPPERLPLSPQRVRGDGDNPWLAPARRRTSA